MITSAWSVRLWRVAAIRAGLRSHPRLADDLKEIMARIGRETKNKV